MGDGWVWWMGMGWLWMIVLIGLIIWAAYTIVSRLDRRDQPRHGEGRDATALEILERRYARGELSDAEFDAMRERLAGTPSTLAASDPRTTNATR